MKPDLILVPQIYLDLPLDEAKIDVNYDAGDKIAVELAKLNAIDPDGDVGVKGIFIDSTANLREGTWLGVPNTGDSCKIKVWHVLLLGQTPT